MIEKNLPELLAPAGNAESLRAALAGGADAVYFGGAEFSNRMRAKNFTAETIRDAIKLCHSCGAAAHITVNTRVRDRELDSVMSFADTLLGGPPDSRADALIIADLGLAREIKKAFPHAVLHASTQTAMMSPSDCAALFDLGFSRLVVPRELSLNEIKSLAALSPIEIEMFIHGAHCVSCSGQCLLSYVMGGRSGNRGECAQPCRLPYRLTAEKSQIGGNYPLSMADMYLGGHITEIILSGVASLKIEGRLKTSTYVYGVTSIYRRLLDERRNASPDEKRALEKLFTRGFTDGYFTSRYRTMAGKKPTENSSNPPSAKEISRALAERQRQTASRRKTADIPLKARFTLEKGSPARLELSLGSTVGRALGELPQPSTGSPITEDSAAKNLMKLGGSGFSLSREDIEFTLRDGLWMQISSINDLRRRALSDLEDKLGSGSRTEKEEPRQEEPADASKFAPISIRSARKHRCKPFLTAEIADFDRFIRGGDDIAHFTERFARVYIPIGQTEGASRSIGMSKLCAVLPVYTPDDSALAEKIKKASDLGVSRVLCHTVGQVRVVKAAGLLADISFRGNITNSSAASVYARLGCSSVTLSPELGIAPARDIASSIPCDTGLIGYGRLPLMLLSRCIICGGACKKGNIGGRCDERLVKPHSCSAKLTDRKGESFPVLAQPDCTNVIYNSVPVWMGDRRDELSLDGSAAFVHFMFTTESLAEAEDVMRAYDAGERRDGRRI